MQRGFVYGSARSGPAGTGIMQEKSGIYTRTIMTSVDFTSAATV
jgi:hypothetical protein